jgi:hypothetical protein
MLDPSIPIELLPIDEIATLKALEDFEREYEGTVCAVCRAEKWASSPFCRGCSIKLQRARLMQRMKDTMDSYGREWQSWPAHSLRYFRRHYDLCRDYLMDVRRHFNSEKGEGR